MLVTYGRLFSYACHAKEALHKLGIEICILKLNQIKPIETECISLCLEKRRVFFFEEGILNGGIGETFGYLLQKNHYPGEFYLNAIEEAFVPQASVKSSLCRFCLDEKGMENIIYGVENRE